jgi:hypothetical protein
MPADKEPLVPLDEIARLLERHEGSPEARPQPASGSRSGLRALGAVGAGALVAGSAFGFGLGSALTTSESAQAAAVGTGFLPARGWTVVQSGTTTATGTARAIAANVPLDARDDVDGLPVRTLASLPERGSVIVATFTTRGDAGADAAFPVRSLPLQVSAAERHRAEHRLRVGVKGTNVDARIFFGRLEPTAEMLASAQRQLNRLVVASERVTIFARPTVAGPTGQPFPYWVRLFGSVDSGKAGESVEIQAKDCGSEFFRLVGGATTESGGGWSTAYSPGINTSLRATWNDVSSAEIAIKAHVIVGLQKRRDGKTIFVYAHAKRSLWRKKVLIQRRARGSWTNLRTVVLTESGGNPGSGPNTGTSGASAEFVPAVPKGTLLRAIMPLSEVKPCYLAGTSREVRT